MHKIKLLSVDELPALDVVLKRWLDRLISDTDKISTSFLCLLALHDVRHRLTGSLLPFEYNYMAGIEDYVSQLELISFINAHIVHKCPHDDQWIEMNARYLIKTCSIGILDPVREIAIGVLKKLLNECEIKSSELRISLCEAMISACESHYCPIGVINSFANIIAVFARKKSLDDVFIYNQVFAMHSEQRAKYILLKRLIATTATMEPFSSNFLNEIKSIRKCQDLCPFVLKIMEVYTCRLFKQKTPGYESEILHIFTDTMHITEYSDENEVQNIDMYFIKPLFEKQPQLRKFLSELTKQNLGVLELLARSATDDFDDFDGHEIFSLLQNSVNAVKINTASYLMCGKNSKLETIDCMRHLQDFIYARRDSEDAALQKFIYTHLLPDFISKLFDNIELNDLLKTLIDSSLKGLVTLPAPKFDLTVLRLIVEKASQLSNPSDTRNSCLKDIFVQIHKQKVMLARTEYGRTSSHKILELLRRTSVEYDIHQVEVTKIYENVIMARSFSDADGYSNLLVTYVDNADEIAKNLCGSLEIQSRARHLLFMMNDVSMLNDNLLFESVSVNPVFPISIALRKLAGKYPNMNCDRESLIDTCRLALNDAKMFFTYSYGNFFETEEDVNDEDDDDSTAFTKNFLQRCFWRSIRHVADLYFLLMKDGNDTLKIRFVDDVCDAMTTVRHWGAVKALIEIYKKILSTIDDCNIERLLQSHILYLNDEVNSVTIERLDEKNCGLAQRFIAIINTNKKRTELLNTLMNALLKSSQRSTEKVCCNTLSVLCYIFKDAALAAVLSGLNWHIRTFEVAVEGLASNSIRIRNTCTHLCICISKHEFMKSSPVELFNFYPNIEQVVYDKLVRFRHFKDHLPYMPSPSYVLLLIIGKCKKINGGGNAFDESYLKKWNVMLSDYLKHEDWHVRCMAANALYNFIRDDDLNNGALIYTMKLFDAQFQNEIHGILCLLRRISETLPMSRAVLSQLELILSKINLHQINEAIIENMLMTNE